MLECRDTHDGRVLDRSFIDPPPAVIKTKEITGCLKEAFRRHGPPGLGVIVLPCVWLSSAGLLSHSGTAEQGRLLSESGVDFPAMGRFDLEEIQAWSARRGLQCGFDREGLF